MSLNILVADDSPVIQKVVNLTLANQGFELSPCQDLDSVIKQLKKNDYHLILLDYNLSADLSGRDILARIRAVAPKIPIVVLHGTFDTVEEEVLQEFDVSEKILKPFNNQLLISTCKRLCEKTEIEVSDLGMDGPVEAEQDQQEDEFAQDEEIDTSGWEVDSSSVEIESEEAVEIEADELWQDDELNSDLDSELQQWGMEVPNVIGEREKKSNISLVPPVIDSTPSPSFTIDVEEMTLDEVAELEQEQEIASIDMSHESIVEFEIEPDAEEDSAILPDDSDLSYPDQEIVAEEPKSRLISLDELQVDDIEEDNLSDDETDPNFSIPASKKSQLEQEIEADVSPEDFWAAEDTEEAFDEQVTVSGAGGELRPDEEEQLVEASRAAEVVIDQDQLLADLKAHLTPLIEKWLQDQYKDAIERVAWEVIPDLAENLIRKEIKSISETFKN
jgi:DNA-binding response OmpR family regulator